MNRIAKPRLESAPLTEEDSSIWTRSKQYAYNGTFFLSRYQDRRDADLTLLQMELRTRFKPWANYIRWCDLNPGDDWRAQ